jgi:GntR family transcriptional regulator
MRNKKLYENISELIESMILESSYKIGDKIPGDYDLMKKFNVSRETVRRAVNLLVENDMLVRNVGKGTFVKRTKKTNFIEEKISFDSELKKLGYSSKTKIIFFEKQKNNLDIFKSEYVYKIHRLRYANEIPFAFEESFIPADIVGDINKDDIKESMHKFLSKEKNIVYKKMHQEIKPVIIDGEISKYLNVQKVPGLELSRLIMTDENIPFIFLKFIFRGDIYVFKNEIIF